MHPCRGCLRHGLRQKRTGRRCPTSVGRDGKGGPGDVDDPEQIGFDLGPEVSTVHLLDRGTVGVAGIVDHDVEAPEIGHGERDGRFGGTGIGDVERRRAELLAVLVWWLLDVFRRRAVASTASPLSKTAVTSSAPKPRDEPVISQVFRPSFMAGGRSFGMRPAGWRCHSAPRSLVVQTTAYALVPLNQLVGLT